MTEEKDALTMAAFRSNHDSRESRQSRKPLASLQLKHCENEESNCESETAAEKTIEKASGDCTAEKLKIVEDYDSGTHDEVDVEPVSSSEEEEVAGPEYSLDDTWLVILSKFFRAHTQLHSL